MKHTIRLTALLAAVMMVAACHKENVETVTPVVGNERDITYTVAEQTTTVHLKSDAEFDALLDRFCNLAQEGSAVTFYNANRGSKGIAAKDVATYSTTNREEMKRWMREQEDAGRTVTVTYNPTTGTWNGRAYTNTPTPEVLSNIPASHVYLPVESWVPGTWEQQPWMAPTGVPSAVNDEPGLHAYLEQYYTVGLRPYERELQSAARLAFSNDASTTPGTTHQGLFTVGEDSVAVTAYEGYRLYQIAQDSMVVLGFHDNTHTQEVQAWLFLRVQ